MVFIPNLLGLFFYESEVIFMHVVLSGYYGFDNVGDDAILYAIIQALQKCQKDVEITVLSNNPEATKKTYGVNAVNRWKMKEVSRAIKESDGLISGGGSLLQDQTSMKTIPYYAGIMRIANWHKKPVFIYAQGMGPINSSFSKMITHSTLNKVANITVRDEDSKKLLEEIGVQKPITIVPDPVIGLDQDAFSSSWLADKPFKDRYIAVSVRDWPSGIDYKRKIAAALDKLIAAGENIVFVPMHGAHDENASAEVVQLMHESSVIAPGNLSIEEKIAVIGQSKLLIGMRLHSLIFSSIYYTPFIAISYDPKIDAFADIMKQPIVGHVEKDNWDGEQLYGMAAEMLGVDENERGDAFGNAPGNARKNGTLRNIVENMKSESLETARMALECFR